MSFYNEYLISERELQALLRDRIELKVLKESGAENLTMVPHIKKAYLNNIAATFGMIEEFDDKNWDWDYDDAARWNLAKYRRVKGD